MHSSLNGFIDRGTLLYIAQSYTLCALDGHFYTLDGHIVCIERTVINAQCLRRTDHFDVTPFHITFILFISPSYFSSFRSWTICCVENIYVLSGN